MLQPPPPAPDRAAGRNPMVAVLLTLVAAVAAVSALAAGGSHTARIIAPIVFLVVSPALVLITAQLERARTSVVRQADVLGNRLDLLDATSNEVVWEIDPQGRLTYISAAAEGLFGLPPEALVGRDVMTLLHPHDIARAQEVLSSAVTRRAGWTNVRLRAIGADGRERWITTSGLARLDRNGELAGFTATTHPMTRDEIDAVEIELVTERVARVVADEALTTVFQPIWSLHRNAVSGVEALTRFQARPLQGPDRWFSDAARSGMAAELELLAVRTALRHARTLPQHLTISVNLSPATIVHGGLERVIAEGGIDVSRLVVELTEHTEIDDYDALVRVLTPLRGKGLQLAVDDAGAGFASFRHILRLRPDYIKLDITLIRGLDLDPAKRALVAAVVLFTLDVGAQVVAEGVETADELQVATLLGVDAAQGYHLGRPTADPDVWASWVAESRAAR